MNKTLELKLKNQFPKLLKEMHGSLSETCMAYGIECDDGWYDLLRIECDDGWYDLLYNHCHELQNWSDTNQIQIVAKQIKEKFAGLKFYIVLEPSIARPPKEKWDEVHEMIRKYEELAERTCELTGGVGEKCQRGYIVKTLCKESAILCGFKPIVKK